MNTPVEQELKELLDSRTVGSIAIELWSCIDGRYAVMARELPSRRIITFAPRKSRNTARRTFNKFISRYAQIKS